MLLDGCEHLLKLSDLYLWQHNCLGYARPKIDLKQTYLGFLPEDYLLWLAARTTVGWRRRWGIPAAARIEHFPLTIVIRITFLNSHRSYCICTVIAKVHILDCTACAPPPAFMVVSKCLQCLAPQIQNKMGGLCIYQSSIIARLSSISYFRWQAMRVRNNRFLKVTLLTVFMALTSVHGCLLLRVSMAKRLLVQSLISDPEASEAFTIK